MSRTRSSLWRCSVRAASSIGSALSGCCSSMSSKIAMQRLLCKYFFATDFFANDSSACGCRRTRLASCRPRIPSCPPRPSPTVCPTIRPSAPSTTCRPSRPHSPSTKRRSPRSPACDPCRRSRTPSCALERAGSCSATWLAPSTRCRRPMRHPRSRRSKRRSRRSCRRIRTRSSSMPSSTGASRRSTTSSTTSTSTPSSATSSSATIREMSHAGAGLDDEAKETLTALNQRLSTLTTTFEKNLLNDTNDLAVVFDDVGGARRAHRGRALGRGAGRRRPRPRRQVGRHAHAVHRAPVPRRR